MISQIDLTNLLTTHPTSVRRVCDLGGLWSAGPQAGDTRVVYRTYGDPGDDTVDPELKYAVTVIEPGEVHGEAFMTRGHVHVRPDRGEWMMGLSGRGKLALRDADGSAWTQDVQPGTIVKIDGKHAHRAANTGDTPFVFVVTWLSDCGHDYSSIETKGFGIVIPRTDA
jgi:glucose-6-phosphate isomerase